MMIMHDEVEITRQAIVTYFSICRCTESALQILVSTGNNMAEKKQLNKQNNLKKKPAEGNELSKENGQEKKELGENN
jgi:hypothetical protein